jgi:MFS family permease
MRSVQAKHRASPPWRRRVFLDLAPLRESRDFRLLELGTLFTGLGTQMALVALPYQVFVVTGSPFQTGLLGAVELLPLVGFSLYGGAIADRFDRRLLLLYTQAALVLVSAGLAAAALTHTHSVLPLYALAGLLAGFGAFESVGRMAIIPNVVPPDRLRSALSFNFGALQLQTVIGPALAGLLIAATGVAAAYIVDGVTCVAMVIAAAAMAPQPAAEAEGDGHPPVLRSVLEGLRFVRREQALMGSFAIDLMAMTFGMPRALFPVLALSVYHAGATGTGFLFAAVAAGATAAALTAGWIEHARRLGRIVIVSVAVWGAAVAAAGLCTTIVPALVLFALAGAADSVSAVCRTTINQTVTPDGMRGRMSSVFMLVVRSGPRLGDLEAGSVASLVSPRFSVVSGGLACLAAVGAILVAFPALVAYDAAGSGGGRR